MTETMTTLSEGHSAHATASNTQSPELNVLTALGTLHLAAPPTVSVEESECEWAGEPPAVFTTYPAAPSLSRPRRAITARCYDAAFAVLILASAAVALYRLVWMGQP